MTAAAWRLRQTLSWSVAGHSLLLGFLFLWGWTVVAPKIPEPIVMLDTAMIELPHGDSPIPGLGTQVAPIEHPPTTPEVIETTVPAETPPTPIAAPTEMAQPQLSPKPTPKPTQVASPKPSATPNKTPVANNTTKPAPQRTSTPVHTATAQTDKFRSLLNAQSRPSTTAAPGVTNSAGWELGTGQKPVSAISPGAVLARYRQAVTARVKGQWMRPASASEAVSVVTVTISDSGSVTGVHLAKSSGDSLKDESAVRAAHRASPLPAPPAEVKERTFSISFKR